MRLHRANRPQVVAVGGALEDRHRAMLEAASLLP
jgi:hypothetical protein